MRALLMYKAYAGLMALYGKTWDIRTKATNIRGDVGIVSLQDKSLYAVADLKDCYLLTKELYEQNRDKNLLTCSFEELPQNYRYVWEFTNVRPCKPIKVTWKQGCRVWADISESCV